MNSTPHKLFFPHLDALRFYSFLMVFVSHVFAFGNFEFQNKYLKLFIAHFLINGDLGVKCFFVISGFLITFLLLSEEEKYGRINLFSFYMRRLLRIWPVYFLVILICFFVLPVAMIDLTEYAGPFNFFPNRDIIWCYLLFVSNFELIEHGVRYVTFSVFWSIAVEEQFYLIWPVLFLFTKRKVLILLTWVLILVSFAYRFIKAHDSSSIHFSTLSVMSDLLIGCLMGISLKKSDYLVRLIRKFSKAKILIVYLLLFLFIPLRGFSHYFGESVFRYYIPFESLIFCFFCCFIILEQHYSQNSLFKFGNHKYTSYLGKISYGLYSYHMLCLAAISLLVNYLHGNTHYNNIFMLLGIFVVSFGLTVMVSYLSYRYIEIRILALKKTYKLER